MNSINDFIATVKATPLQSAFYAYSLVLGSSCAYRKLRESLRRPTRTGFSDPEIKASRERELAIRRRLNLKEWNLP